METRIQLLALVFFLLGILSQSALSEPQITCEPYYQLYTDCRLNSEDVLSAPYNIQLDSEIEDVETEYRFEYRYNCDEKKLPLTWSTGDQVFVVEKAEDWTPLSIQGASSLTIRQSAASLKQTQREVYAEWCRVDLRNLDAVPSASTISVWQKKHLAMSADVAAAVHSVTMINDIILFKSAFVFLGELNTLFLDELAANERSRKLIKFKDLAESFQKLQEKSPDFLSAAEVESIHNFSKVVESMSDQDLWTNEDGSSKSLSDFISEEDGEVISHLEQRIGEGEDYHAQRLKIYRKINSLNESIQTLAGLLEKWKGANQ
ncbi:hypothetical protein N9D31_01360 [Oligoflexaceae bacterium]|nr:hypothetical protein [Oligoflexaceae bacterium]